MIKPANKRGIKAELIATENDRFVQEIFQRPADIALGSFHLSVAISRSNRCMPRALNSLFNLKRRKRIRRASPLLLWTSDYVSSFAYLQLHCSVICWTLLLNSLKLSETKFCPLVIATRAHLYPVSSGKKSEKLSERIPYNGREVSTNSKGLVTSAIRAINKVKLKKKTKFLVMFMPSRHSNLIYPNN